MCGPPPQSWPQPPPCQPPWNPPPWNPPPWNPPPWKPPPPWNPPPWNPPPWNPPPWKPPPPWNPPRLAAAAPPAAPRTRAAATTIARPNRAHFISLSLDTRANTRRRSRSRGRRRSRVRRIPAHRPSVSSARRRAVTRGAGTACRHWSKALLMVSSALSMPPYIPLQFFRITQEGTSAQSGSTGAPAIGAGKARVEESALTSRRRPSYGAPHARPPAPPSPARRLCQQSARRPREPARAGRHPLRRGDRLGNGRAPHARGPTRRHGRAGHDRPVREPPLPRPAAGPWLRRPRRAQRRDGGGVGAVLRRRAQPRLLPAAEPTGRVAVHRDAGRDAARGDGAAAARAHAGRGAVPDRRRVLGLPGGRSPEPAALDADRERARLRDRGRQHARLRLLGRRVRPLRP